MMRRGCAARALACVVGSTYNASMKTRALMTMHVLVGAPQKIGTVPFGKRITAPITGGTFEGARMRGKVLPGGGDWTILRSDGVLELDLLATLETDDGALVHMAS